MRVACDFACVGMRAKEMGAAAVEPALEARIFGVQPLQRLREARIGDSQEGVVVASHENVGEECELEALTDCAEPGEEVLAVSVAEEEIAVVAAVCGEVVNAGNEQAGASGHATRL